MVGGQKHGSLYREEGGCTSGGPMYEVNGDAVGTKVSVPYRQGGHLSEVFKGGFHYYRTPMETLLQGP